MDIIKMTRTMGYDISESTVMAIYEMVDWFISIYDKSFDVPMVCDISDMLVIYETLFESGITWGRVIGAIALADRIARHIPENADKVAHACARHLETSAGSWIRELGWDDCATFYGKSSRSILGKIASKLLRKS